MAYIDPITGAYVADGLDALPPGYNQPKAGNEANVAKMRATLNNSWNDNTPLPDIPSGKSTSPTDLIKYAYQNMPGAGIPQATIAALSDMLGGTVGNIYGVGKQALSGELGNADAGNRAFADAQKLAQLFHYNPPTKAGQDIYSAYNKVGEATGPLPELWNTNARFTPDDLRALLKTGVEDVRNFPMDYANARQGLTRDYPTMGSRAAEFTDLSGNITRPLAEKAYDMYMNPQSSVEVSGLKPGANLSGLFDAGSPMYAVKPKGGNWPTNLGSTNPLKEQGSLGEHLSKVQYSDPLAVFQQQLEKHYARGIDNRQLVHDWEDYRTKRIGSALNPNSPDSYLSNEELAKKIADEFAEAYNAGTIGSADIEPTNKKLYTASQIAETLPHYNSWVMGPFQKYITNQMGTGLATDPLLQAVNESGMPPHEIFGQDVPRDWEVESITKRADQRREDFPDKLFGYSDTPEKQASLQNSPIGKITATTPEGIAYENALDASLYAKAPYSFKADAGYPVVAKLDRDTLISDFLTEPESRAGFKEIRKKVFQDLLAGNLDPTKLSNVTPATVTRQMIKDKMAQFKEQQLNKKLAKEWAPKRIAEMPADMQFDDGSKMVLITPEMAKTNENLTARDLGQITIDLNQCIGAGCHATQDYPGHGPYIVPHTGKPPRGKVEYDKYGYMRRLKDGQIEIASLKDPQGESQATIELKFEGKALDTANLLLKRHREIKEWLSENAPDRLSKYMDDFSIDGMSDRVINNLWDVPGFDEFIGSLNTSRKKSIEQIKGIDNGEIIPEYSEHLRAWLNENADTLTNVRDLKNVPNVHDLNDHYVALDKLTADHKDWSIEAAEKLFHEADDNKLLPRFFNAEQFEELANKMGVNLMEDPIHTNERSSAALEKAYQKVSQQIVDTFEDAYVQEAFSNGDNPALTAILREIQERPLGYGLGDFSPAIRQQVIEKLRNEALHGHPRNLENIAQGFEAEPEQNPPLHRHQQYQLEALRQNMDSFFDGQEHNLPEDMIEPFATDTRILMGNRRPEAALPTGLHREIVGWLLDMDNNTANIRRAIDALQNEPVRTLDLTEAQAENILNMLISWTEWYPLNER